MANISKTYLFRVAAPAAALALLSLAPSPARADFFDDMRKTFTNDVPHFFQNDVPHFFQDDIPCAFGQKPTSGTKTSCQAPPPRVDPEPLDRSNASAPVSNAPAPTAPAGAPPRDTIEQRQLPPPGAD